MEQDKQKQLPKNLETQVKTAPAEKVNEAISHVLRDFKHALIALGNA